MPEFVKGLTLSRTFFEDAVRPILRKHLPKLEYSAGLIGSGSEVLGFDDEMSADHHWGPRVMLFFSEDDYPKHRDGVDALLRNELPNEVLGYPTNFGTPDPNDHNVQLLKAVDSGPINHRVEIFTIRGYLISYLDFDISNEIAAADWLTFPEQKLRSISDGKLFEDGIGIRPVLQRFSYYPHDVWLYLLAAGWNRIGQEEHLMGRAGLAGDELGSALIASRLVRDIMRLCFLMERQYAPYPKWFGTAFRRLECADKLLLNLEKALWARGWKEREEGVVAAYEKIAEMHNDLAITEPLSIKAGHFFGRPFRVIELAGGFSKAIAAQITDVKVNRIANKKPIGSVDQFSDSTDMLSDPKWRPTLRKLYE
jgi:hypothetical protein